MKRYHIITSTRSLGTYRYDIIGGLIENNGFYYIEISETVTFSENWNGAIKNAKSLRLPIESTIIQELSIDKPKKETNDQ